MSAAQFKLSFDSSKFDSSKISVSKGSYNPATNQYVYLNYEDVADLGNVTFTFKSKATGSGTFAVSNLVLSSSTATIGTSKATVTVVAKAATPNKTTPKEEPVPESEIVNKPELERVKLDIADLVQSDYTADSWKALQDYISKAEAAKTNSEYDEVKGNLSIDKLVVESFDKEELFDLLIELIGKSEKDYTKDSWNELQEAIDSAQSAKLKSEYNRVKDKLTTKDLVKRTGIDAFFEDFIQRVKDGDAVYIVCAGMAGMILLLILILIVTVIKNRRIREEKGARRLK